MNETTFDLSRVKITATETDKLPPWSDLRDDTWQGRSWRCALRYGGRSLTVPFFTGSAIKDAPTAKDVLSCLVQDAWGAENARSFEDWCAEYGYDTDSRKAEKTWRACERIRDRLDRFIPSWREIPQDELD